MALGTRTHGGRVQEENGRLLAMRPPIRLAGGRAHLGVRPQRARGLQQPPRRTRADDRAIRVAHHLPAGENVHFYYHERTETEWEPGGYTSGAEIRRMGLRPVRLRVRADRIAGCISASIGGVHQPR